MLADGAGNTRTLLTQKGKVNKYKAEIKTGNMFTNDGNVKTTESGRNMTLTPGQRAYRQGYINAMGESAAIYNKKKGK